jgi:hypothetical protein
MNLLEHLRRYGDDWDFVPPHQPAPTQAEPGSREKIAVMAARVLAGEEIHHERDERLQAPHWVRIIARECKMIEVPKELRDYCQDNAQA